MAKLNHKGKQCSNKNQTLQDISRAQKKQDGVRQNKMDVVKENMTTDDFENRLLSKMKEQREKTRVLKGIKGRDRRHMEKDRDKVDKELSSLLQTVANSEMGGRRRLQPDEVIPGKAQPNGQLLTMATIGLANWQSIWVQELLNEQKERNG